MHKPDILSLWMKAYIYVIYEWHLWQHTTYELQNLTNMTESEKELDEGLPSRMEAPQVLGIDKMFQTLGI